MPLADVFTREVLAGGRLFPAGAKVPADVYSYRQLRLRRDSGLIVSQDDTGQEFPQPSAPLVRSLTAPLVPFSQVAEQRARVADLQIMLADAGRELETMEANAAATGDPNVTPDAPSPMDDPTFLGGLENLSADGKPKSVATPVSESAETNTPTAEGVPVIEEAPTEVIPDEATEDMASWLFE